MGCSASRLEDEEAVQLCRDRKKFIKQAIEQRNKLALGHIAYLQAIRRVSLALRSYVDGDDHHHHNSDSMSGDSYYSTPPFTPIKRLSTDMPAALPLHYSPLQQPAIHKTSSCAAHYLRSGGNASVSVEERPRSPETVRINSYYNSNSTNIPGEQQQYYGMGSSIFGMQPPPSPTNQSLFFPPPPSPYARSPYSIPPQYPPPSPSNSQWDFFWNPFASLESYGYPGHGRLNGVGVGIDDEIAGLRQVREEEGIPDLEEEEDDVDDNSEEEDDDKQHAQTVANSMPAVSVDKKKQQPAPLSVEVTTRPSSSSSTNGVSEQVQWKDQVKEPQQSHDPVVSYIAREEEDVKAEMVDEKRMIGREVDAEETGTPGFTVYLDRRRPVGLQEVIREIEQQFKRICDSAREMSAMLEATRAPCSSSSNPSELTAIKMLNPVALFRSASSRSSSSRFSQAPTPPPHSLLRDDLYETSSDVSDESCLLSGGSHHSTLDRLYAWEKKLFEEVKSGERIRKAYEKKCLQLTNQDAAWDEDPTARSKTRRVERDLGTQIKVSIHSIEAISKRIETLRDEELQPQIMELLQGLGRMWKIMADCHQIQKRVIDDAKLLLANPKLADRPPPATRLARSASNLELELRNWRSCLQTWITAQRSYLHALTGWLLRCAPLPHDQPPAQRSSPLSPPRSSGEPPIFRLCIHWSRMAESISEAQAAEGLDFFAAGVASVVAQCKEAEEARRKAMARGAVGEEEEEEVERGKEEVACVEKIAEVGVRVVCAGMSVAVGGLAELAVKSRDGCEDLARRMTTVASSSSSSL